MIDELVPWTNNSGLDGEKFVAGLTIEGDKNGNPGSSPEPPLGKSIFLGIILLIIITAVVYFSITLEPAP